MVGFDSESAAHSLPDILRPRTMTNTEGWEGTYGGYRLIEITPVDQFRYAAHVEIAARLER